MASIFDEISPTWLKNTYLTGVDLTQDDGSEYPESVYTQSLNYAVAWLEHELGIAIDPITVKNERHDARELDKASWWPFRLDMRPVKKITKFGIKYGSYDTVDVPVGWCQLLSPIHGQVHLVPSSESVGSYLFRAGIPMIVGDAFMPVEYVPGYFNFDYTAGFTLKSGEVNVPDGAASVEVTFAEAYDNEQWHMSSAVVGGGAVIGKLTRTAEGFTQAFTTPPTGPTTLTWITSNIPYDMLHVIGMKAAMLPLDHAGDLLGGAGVANFSIGADGVHQSLGTTSSATNAGYGAKILSYSKQLKALLPALRAKYKTMYMAAI